MQPAIAGLVIGIGVALALGRYVESVLYGVESYDPFVFTIAITLMGGVALVATAVPAFRASTTDPVKVLNGE
jgi:ABC-type antimicrobial peptide transport system permease subunit